MLSVLSMANPAVDLFVNIFLKCLFLSLNTQSLWVLTVKVNLFWAVYFWVLLFIHLAMLCILI